MFTELDFDTWAKTYKPIKNHIDPNASFQDESGQGIMFETYGAEYEFVKEQNPLNIWTYGDGDDSGSYIWNGYHFINRLGYFITEVPAPSEEENVIQIKVSSPWFYCENCNNEFEDEDNLIRDAFDEIEIEKCPKCASPEELAKFKELQCAWCDKPVMHYMADFNAGDICTECVEEAIVDTDDTDVIE